MNLVDEQHRPFLGVAQIRQQILGRGQRRTTGDLQGDPEFVRDAGRKGRLAEARRSVEQDMAEHLPSLPRGVHGNREPLEGGPLTDHVRHPLRPQNAIIAIGLVGTRE